MARHSPLLRFSTLPPCHRAQELQGLLGDTRAAFKLLMESVKEKEVAVDGLERQVGGGGSGGQGWGWAEGGQAVAGRQAGRWVNCAGQCARPLPARSAPHALHHLPACLPACLQVETLRNNLEGMRRARDEAVDAAQVGAGGGSGGVQAAGSKTSR